MRKSRGMYPTWHFLSPQFLKDGIPYMNEVQEEILRQHLLADTWKVCRWAVIQEVSPQYCAHGSASLRSHFVEILKTVGLNTLLPAVPACHGVWRKVEITGYYVENCVLVGKWSFGIPTARHKASPVKSISHTASFPTFSTNVDRDVLKKAIDEVTSWIVAAKEDDTMILQDLNGMKQCLF